MKQAYAMLTYRMAYFYSWNMALALSHDSPLEYLTLQAFS